MLECPGSCARRCQLVYRGLILITYLACRCVNFLGRKKKGRPFTLPNARYVNRTNVQTSWRRPRPLRYQPVLAHRNRWYIRLPSRREFIDSTTGDVVRRRTGASKPRQAAGRLPTFTPPDPPRIPGECICYSFSSHRQYWFSKARH